MRYAVITLAVVFGGLIFVFAGFEMLMHHIVTCGNECRVDIRTDLDWLLGPMQ